MLVAPKLPRTTVVRDANSQATVLVSWCGRSTVYQDPMDGYSRLSIAVYRLYSAGGTIPPMDTSASDGGRCLEGICIDREVHTGLLCAFDETWNVSRVLRGEGLLRMSVGRQ